MAASTESSSGCIVRKLRRVRVNDGPIGPMRFDKHGDPIPRHVVLYRMRNGTVLPEEP